MPQDADKTGREILPIPDQPHRGPVPFDARDASAPQQPMLRAPNGAPNVVIVLIDDIGFGTQASLEAVSTCPPRIVWRKPGCATRARNNFY